MEVAAQSMSTMSEPPAPSREPVEAAAAVHLCLLLGRILFHFGATTQRIPGFHRRGSLVFWAAKSKCS
jgi:hypothetical protein